MKTLTVHSFFRKYPDENICFETIKNLKYPQGIYCKTCKKITHFTKVRNRPLYQCSCGYQISIRKDTIFEHSAIPLHYWFYAMFLLATSKSGVPAKHLQRTLGISYGASYRMGMKIRSVMKSPETVCGLVEIDETYIGGQMKNRKFIEWQKAKECVFGAVERNGNLIMRHVPDNGYVTLNRAIKDIIEPKSHIMSDQLMAYARLHQKGYAHDTVLHQREFVRGNVHTQTIEGVWSYLKRGIHGTYRQVGHWNLQEYINEYAWRYNQRKNNNPFQSLLIASVVQ